MNQKQVIVDTVIFRPKFNEIYTTNENGHRGVYLANQKRIITFLRTHGGDKIDIICNQEEKKYFNRITKVAKATGYINKVKRIAKLGGDDIRGFWYYDIEGYFVKEGFE